MKCITLLHTSEYPGGILSYHYDKHAWLYDAKFWLVNDKWCVKLDGTWPVGELREEEKKIILEYEPIIKLREKENRRWLAFQDCRKRTCVCKSCSKFCQCGACSEKQTECRANIAN